jgi:hypothetical protein
MWQQQGHYMFSNMIPFLNNAYLDQQNPNNIPENKISYERKPNQEQYASYPPDAIYRHASGPGWQQQQIVYPPNLFK